MPATLVLAKGSSAGALNPIFPLLLEDVSTAQTRLEVYLESPESTHLRVHLQELGWLEELSLPRKSLQKVWLSYSLTDEPQIQKVAHRVEGAFLAEQKIEFEHSFQVVYSFTTGVFVQVKSLPITGEVIFSNVQPTSASIISQRDEFSRPVPIISITSEGQQFAKTQLGDLYKSLMGFLKNHISYSLIKTKELEVGVFDDPEEDRNELVITITVDAPPQQAIDYWDRLGRALDEWKKKLDIDDAFHLDANVAIHVHWS